VIDLARIGQATFLHCMPLRRNLEIADDVMESPQNAAYEEAENRLHVQKAILTELLA
jgi:ornithine carbamoyltransferase